MAVPVCRYCHVPIGVGDARVNWPDGHVAHVGCEINARRQGRGHG